MAALACRQWGICRRKERLVVPRRPSRQEQFLRPHWIIIAVLTAIVRSGRRYDVTVSIEHCPTNDSTGIFSAHLLWHWYSPTPICQTGKLEYDDRNMPFLRTIKELAISDFRNTWYGDDQSRNVCESLCAQCFLTDDFPG